MKHDPWAEIPLPSTWLVVPLGTLCNVVRGASPRPMGDPRYFGGQIPFLKIADVTASDGMTVRTTDASVTEEGAARSRKIEAGRLLLTNSATVCIPIFLGVDACIHDGFLAFEDIPADIDQKYIYYFFRYIRPYVISQHKQGVTQVNLNTTIVSEINFLLPPTLEQRRIVAKIENLFSQLDKGVEALTVAMQQLTTYRHSLLRHAFRGQLTQRWRALQSKEQSTVRDHSAALQRAKDLRFTESVRNWQEGNKKAPMPKKPPLDAERDANSFSTLQSLPEGWAYVPFSAIAYSIRNGISNKPSETGSLRILRISAVRPMAFDLTDFRHIDDDPDFLSYRLERGDIVFTRYNGSRAYVGVAALYRSDEKFVYPDKLIRCDVRSPLVDAGYIEKAVNCGESRAFIESRIRTTAGQAGISGADLKAMPVPICPIEEQVVINEILETRLSEIASTEHEIVNQLDQAELLRQSILRQAFTGNLVAQDPVEEHSSAVLARIGAASGGDSRPNPHSRKDGKRDAA